MKLLTPERKARLFQIVNKWLFCKIINFHLPLQKDGGFSCLLCDKKML